jgi:phosphoglucomutase
LFLGIDTHALSQPAVDSALEVLAANGIDVMLAGREEYTPTPVISHAILTYNRGRTAGFADGIVITPSHNPPDTGGFKYNPPHGGPAEEKITTWIEHEPTNFSPISSRVSIESRSIKHWRRPRRIATIS